MRGFRHAVGQQNRDATEQTELDLISAQPEVLHSPLSQQIEITAVAEPLPGYGNIISIKSTDPC